jgi:hypothetical protein
MKDTLRKAMLFAESQIIEGEKLLACPDLRIDHRIEVERAIAEYKDESYELALMLVEADA